MNNNTYRIADETEGRRRRSVFSVIVFILLVGALVYIVYQVTFISQKIAGIKISDDKIEFVYGKVGDLVKILNTKEDMNVDYNPTESYDFKPKENELTAEDTETVAQQKDESLKEELGKMKAPDKLKLVRDKLVDIYQQSKTKDEELAKVKQSFYETKTLVENWYNDKENIKDTKGTKPSEGASQGNIFSKLKENLSNFVEINKVGQDLSKSGKKILTIDQIPQMLSYAEILLEAGSLSQASWIMEDIETISKQEEIFDFTAKAEIYAEKYPNPNADIQQIKELIEIVDQSDK